MTTEVSQFGLLLISIADLDEYKSTGEYLLEFCFLVIVNDFTIIQYVITVFELVYYIWLIQHIKFTRIYWTEAKNY